MDQWALESEPMTNPKLLAEPESTELLDRLTPDWQLHLHDDAIIDHVLKVINRAPRRLQKSHVTIELSAKAPTWSPTKNNVDSGATFAVFWFSGILIGLSEEAGMIALTLVRVIERHSTELATELVTKLGTSSRTTDLRKGGDKSRKSCST
jgi:hypothetical protein